MGIIISDCCIVRVLSFQILLKMLEFLNSSFQSVKKIVDVIWLFVRCCLHESLLRRLVWFPKEPVKVYNNCSIGEWNACI